MGRPRWQLAAWSANSSEVPPWRRWRKWRIRPYQAPTDTAERRRRWRRARRSYERAGRRVFAVAREHELVGVAAAVAAELRASGGSRGNEIRTDELVGRRAGCCSSRGRPCQGIHGAWQCEQETGDECHPRGARCLMAVRYCSSHSDDLNRLTARLQHVNTAKPLIHCKNREHENCRPTIHLQLLFKDHRLILHGSEVTSSQKLA